MAKKKRMPNSIRKYIRKEKARIRREVLDIMEQRNMIDKLYDRFSEKQTDIDAESSKLKRQSAKLQPKAKNK